MPPQDLMRQDVEQGSEDEEWLWACHGLLHSDGLTGRLTGNRSPGGEGKKLTGR